MAKTDYFRGKRITLMGLGLLGRGVGDARFLANQGAEVIVTDLKSVSELETSLAHLRQYPNLHFHLGGHRTEDFENRDLIIKAAGVPLDSPFIAHAKTSGIPVRMSADLFAEFAGVPLVGVTGTRGKSTTTHIIAHLLRTGGYDVLLGGNVKGVSTLELLAKPKKPDTVAVLELDSWQLQGFGEAKLSPDIAVFTNFLPDHMNYYRGDMRAYFADKANIFLHQKPGDTLIMSEQAAGVLREYGYESRVPGELRVVKSDALPSDIELRVPGKHNRLNAALAAEAARVLRVDEAVIAEALANFPGIPGRLELVRELRGIRIYNDTTSTVPEAAIAALRAVGDETKRNVILIMGGSDKGLDMDPLIAEAKRYCKKVLLLAGTGTERIKTLFPESVVYESLLPAVDDAVLQADAGDIVLFSPAFASFGMFHNEYERGEQFDAAVQSLA